MTAAGSPGADLLCEEFVQVVTAYLEDALPGDMQARVDEHLAGCLGCRNLLTQWRTVIDLAGQLTDADVDSADELTRDRLLSLFRGLRRR
jgi:predicted anti-sigma-YlaC factor YlaD